MWTVGTVDDGSTATLTLLATVDAGTSGDTITNTVTNVTLDQNDADDLYLAVVIDGADQLNPNAANALLKYNLLNTDSQVHVPGPAALPWGPTVSRT